MNNIDHRDPEWLAEKLGLDKNTIYKHLQDGTIPGLRLGRRWLVSEAEIAEWLRVESAKQTTARREATASTEHLVRQLTNYSSQARQALRRAHAEARGYGHVQLEQEHLILAMMADPECAAARILTESGVAADRFRQEFEQRCPASDTIPPRRIARSPAAKKAMRLAADFAKTIASPLVHTEHLLVGILAVHEGVGFEFLSAAGLTLAATREKAAKAGNVETP